MANAEQLFGRRTGRHTHPYWLTFADDDCPRCIADALRAALIRAGWSADRGPATAEPVGADAEPGDLW